MSTGLDCRQEFLLCCTLIRRSCPSGNRRKLVGPAYAQARLGLKNPRCRDAHIVILLQCGLDQLLQFVVLENGRPFLLSKGFGVSSGHFFRGQTAISGRSFDFRPFVIRPDGAATQEGNDQRKNEGLLHLSHLPFGDFRKEGAMCPQEPLSLSWIWRTSPPRKTAPEPGKCQARWRPACRR